MNDSLRVFASIAFAYLIGSIPTGVWLTKRTTGRDIREMGDCNTGARNVSHVVGFKEGFIVGLVDFTKGLLAILFTQNAGLGTGWQVACGVTSVIGHDFPVFAEFQGGQGMATMIGTTLGVTSLIFLPEIPQDTKRVAP